MRKKFRFLTVLAVCVMVLSCFSVTAFAYADDTECDHQYERAGQRNGPPQGEGRFPCRGLSPLTYFHIKRRVGLQAAQRLLRHLRQLVKLHSVPHPPLTIP